jgi:uncharacterized protein YndB with AHSA1/START domain
MKDVIEQSLLLEAPRDRVWSAISEPSGLTGWFCELGVEGEIAEGQDVILCFRMSPSTNEDGRCRAKIVAIEPKTRFAYRWWPGTCSVAEIDDTKSTLVELLLSDKGEGTLVTVRESGFTSLPDDWAGYSYGQNDEGWAECLTMLEKYAKAFGA